MPRTSTWNAGGPPLELNSFLWKYSFIGPMPPAESTECFVRGNRSINQSIKMRDNEMTLVTGWVYLCLLYHHTIYNSAKRSLLMVKRFGRLGCYTSYTVCTCKIMQRYEVHCGTPTSIHHRCDCHKGTGTDRRQSPLSRIWSPCVPLR